MGQVFKTESKPLSFTKKAVWLRETITRPQARSHWLGWSGFNLTTFIISSYIASYNMIDFSCNINKQI